MEPCMAAFSLDCDSEQGEKNARLLQKHFNKHNKNVVLQLQVSIFR